MPEEYTIIHREEIERNGSWSLVRRSLGLDSFGINIVEIPPGGTIPEHDEIDRDQEEVFLVLEGSPSVVINGEPHSARAGTFVRLDPEPRRTGSATSTGSPLTRIASGASVSINASSGRARSRATVACSNPSRSSGRSPEAAFPAAPNRRIMGSDVRSRHSQAHGDRGSRGRL